MYFRSLWKWDDLESCKNLVLFVQYVEEMLNEYSLDTYKPSVMQTSLLCYEAKDTIEDIRRGYIRRPNIDHVLDELCDSLEKDAVAQSLIKVPLGNLKSIIKNVKEDLRSKEEVVGLLCRWLAPARYRLKNEELLVRSVGSECDASALRRLARTYVSTLISIGYSEFYIRNSATKFFYHGGNRIGSPSAIEDFFALFAHGTKQYDVVFVVGQRTEGRDELYEIIGFKVCMELPKKIADLDNPFKKRRGTVFLVCPDVDAYDPFSAMAIAEARLSDVSSLVNVFSHSASINIGKTRLVADFDAKKCHVFGERIHPMMKCRDLDYENALSRLTVTLNDFHLDDGSFSKFLNCIRLHSAALKSRSLENQLLNLWIAIESLVPSPQDEERAATIENVAGAIVPLLCLRYFSVLLSSFAAEIKSWSQKHYEDLLCDVCGGRDDRRLARVFALQEYEERRLNFVSKLRDYHIMRDRFLYFSAVFSSPASVLSALEAHERRLRWQIRRIYRARNLIVHAGRAPKYLHSIVSHAHDYLDYVISMVVGLGNNMENFSTVDQFFRFVGLEYCSVMQVLGKKDAVFSEENIDVAIFDS